MRAGEQLFGRLAKLQDLCQHGDSLIGVLNACQTDRGRGNVRPMRGGDEHLEIFSLDFLFCTCHSRSRPHRSVGETLRKENDEMNINRWHVFAPLVQRVAVVYVTVVSRHSFTAPLLEAKHQVNPLMKVF